jgi:hypothetical protein
LTFWFLINGGAAFTLTVMIRKVFAGVSLIFLCFSFAAAASKPNLVLITIDSARADRMGFLGAKGALTPNLDRLAGESIVFEHAYAQAPASVVSHATILSGAYPQSTGMSEIGGTLSATLPYLPELLKTQGYRTAAFVGSIDLDPWNGLAQGFDRGFQSYDAGFRPAISGDARPPLTERRGAEVVARAVAWLDHNAQGQVQGQFFLWVHISDARAPGSSYNSGITATDAAVGKLISALQQRKVYGDTAVIVVAGHGEGLGAHGEDANGIFLYDETVHVPLLIKLPQGQRRRVSLRPNRQARGWLARYGLWISLLLCLKSLRFRCLRKCPDSPCCASRKRAVVAVISPCIPAAICLNADSAGARLNHGARASISTFELRSPSSTT